MDKAVRDRLELLFDRTDKEGGYLAFAELNSQAADKVPWAYEVWDRLKELLAAGDNHQRSMAAQLLSNLAKSDPEGRMKEDFHLLTRATFDERFVTARHSLQSLWKIGLASAPYRDMLLAGLEKRFADAAEEKNGTLIRFDIVEGLRKLYDAGGASDETVRQHALALIETESDPKYKKKYAAVWRK
jgi:hypothetical protein